MQSHTDAFVCDHQGCGKRLSCRSTLVAHKRTHTGERPFVCAECHKAFALSTALHRHWRVHTGETPYECSLCAKRFTQRNNRDVHMRIHTGERPFPCGACGERFRVKCLLQRHEKKTGHGKRPAENDGGVAAGAPPEKRARQ
jgi:KRAB domain-containing zinc finger protein